MIYYNTSFKINNTSYKNGDEGLRTDNKVIT